MTFTGTLIFFPQGSSSVFPNILMLFVGMTTMLLFFILSSNLFSVFLWFKNGALDFLGFNFGSGFLGGLKSEGFFGC